MWRPGSAITPVALSTRRLPTRERPTKAWSPTTSSTRSTPSRTRTKMDGTITAPTESPWIAAVRLSDSFRTAVAGVAAELGADLLEWMPAGGEGPPVGAALVLLLAGGEESAALDVLADLGTSAVPVFL